MQKRVKKQRTEQYKLQEGQNKERMCDTANFVMNEIDKTINALAHNRCAHVSAREGGVVSQSQNSCVDV